MKFDTSRIIDSNGDKYRVGWDEHGWFSIEEVTLYPYRPEFDDGDSTAVETDAGLMAVVVDSDYPTSFSPAGAEELIAEIEEGL